jgi:hypothetical protein
MGAGADGPFGGYARRHQVGPETLRVTVGGSNSSDLVLRCPRALEPSTTFCPGEFGVAELPEIPSGFRYATCVSRLWRDGDPVGCYRSLMTVCDGQPLDLIRASH